MPEIAIIGGGIGGLSTAIALGRYGFAAEVFEEAPLLLDLGAAIALWPNAMRALQHLGLAQKVVDAAGVINEIRWLHPDGTILNSVALGSRETAAVALHRADLQKILLQELPTSLVHLGHSFLEQHDQKESTKINFNDSRSLESRLLIGADGVHSQVRPGITNEGSHYSRGYMVWRGISSVMPAALPSDAAMELHGRGKRFGIGPVGHGRVGWWAAANASLESGIVKELIADAHDELIELFDDWYPPVLDLIRSTPTILRTEASDRRSTTTWGRGRTTLLGDAIHPTTPNLGQGGCMAIEDAVVLSRCFEKYGLSESALRAYERVRYGRTRSITEFSRWYGAIGQWENSFAAGLRSTVIKTVPRSLIKQLMRLVFDYDAATVRI